MHKKRIFVIVGWLRVGCMAQAVAFLPQAACKQCGRFFRKSGPWDDKCLANRWGIENYVIPLHTFTINTNNIELT